MNHITPNRTTAYTCQELGVCQSRPGCQQCSHDTEALPPGGYYFAPGSIDHEVRSRKRLTGLQRFARDCIVLLAVSGLIGFAAACLQAKGWPL